MSVNKTKENDVINSSNNTVLTHSFVLSPSTATILQDWSTPESTIAKSEQSPDNFSLDEQVNVLHFKLPPTVISSESLKVSSPHYAESHKNYFNQSIVQNRKRKKCFYEEKTDFIVSDAVGSRSLDETVTCCRKLNGNKDIERASGKKLKGSEEAITCNEERCDKSFKEKERGWSSDCAKIALYLESDVGNDTKSGKININTSVYKKNKILKRDVDKQKHEDAEYAKSLYFSSSRRKFFKYQPGFVIGNDSQIHDIQSRPCYYHENNKEWRAKWRENGIARQKTFSARRFGYTTARKTCEWIKQYIDENGRIPTDLEINEKVQKLLQISIPEEEKIPPPKNPLNTGRKRRITGKKLKEFSSIFGEVKSIPCSLNENVEKMKILSPIIKDEVNSSEDYNIPLCVAKCVKSNLNFSSHQKQQNHDNNYNRHNLNFKQKKLYYNEVNHSLEPYSSGNLEMCPCRNSLCIDALCTRVSLADNSILQKKGRHVQNKIALDRNSSLFHSKSTKINHLCHKNVAAEKLIFTLVPPVFYVSQEPCKSEVEFMDSNHYIIPMNNYSSQNNFYFKKQAGKLVDPIYYISDYQKLPLNYLKVENLVPCRYEMQPSRVLCKCKSDCKSVHNADIQEKYLIVKSLTTADQDTKKTNKSDGTSTPPLFDRFVKDYAERKQIQFSVNENSFCNSSETDLFDSFNLSDHEELLTNLIINEDDSAVNSVSK